MNLKALKLLHHLKGKLKDVMIAATAGYAENTLIMSVSLIHSINRHFILHLYTSFISLRLCKYITVLFMILYMGCCK